MTGTYSELPNKLVSAANDPSVMLYVPLPIAIYVDAANRTRFAVDKPSAVFASFASPPISQVGIELDRKLAALLDALDVPARRTLDRPT